MKRHTKEENNYIRYRKRNFRFISLPSNYDDCGFTGMKTFVEMVSHTRKKAITMYFISNTKDTELIAEAIERRWEIENNFHKEKILT